MPTNTPTVPTSLLDAVNALLRAIGRAPVSSLLTSSLTADGAEALDVLGQTSVNLQSEGWHFNTEKGRSIDPSPSGEISLPANTVKVVMAWPTRGYDLAQDGNRLYDRTKHTFEIGRPVTADLTTLKPFDHLPQAFRWYITVKAARRFATAKVPTGASLQFTQIDEDDARTKAEQFDADTEDRTLPEANPHFQNHRRR